MEQTISACIIVKNEEKNIKRCLDSIKTLCKEIIIVDTGSSDRTKEIVNGYTEKIYDIEWVNNFSVTRNFSLSKAESDWILIIDADETISESDHKEIKEIINDHNIDACYFNWRNYTNNTGVVGYISSKEDSYKESKIANGYSVSKVIRLFRNKKEYYFEGKIHETVQGSIISHQGNICDSKVVLHHYGEMDPKRFEEKKIKYIDLLKSRIENKEFDEKSEDFVYYELSKEYIHLEDYKNAEECLVRATQLKIKPDYLLLLGGIYIKNKEYSPAERILKKCAELDPFNPGVHNNLGIIYSNQDNSKKAIKKFEKAILINPGFADAYFNLGIELQKGNKLKEAEYYLDKAIDLNPKFKEKLNNNGI